MTCVGNVTGKGTGAGISGTKAGAGDDGGVLMSLGGVNKRCRSRRGVDGNGKDEAPERLDSDEGDERSVGDANVGVDGAGDIVGD